MSKSETLLEFFFKKFKEFPTPLINPKLSRVLKEAGPGNPTLTARSIFSNFSFSHQVIKGSALKKN